MMKLSRDEIKFIDTYLQSSDVVYVDIRQEMVDHIATAIEEKMQSEQHDFYKAFKSYMLTNKGDILKNNKNRWSFSWEAIRQFLLFLIRPYMVSLAILLFFFFENVAVNNYFSDDFTLENLFFALVLTALLFQSGYIYLYLKKRFYTVEKTSVILALLYYGQLFLFPAFRTEQVSTVSLTIFSFLFFGYVVFFIKELVKFHQHRFNYI